MGKNQAHKAMKSSSGRGGGGEGELDTSHLGVDASFHTSEWHAARLAALTVERPSYEDWKSKQKEAEAREQALLDEQERAMREYKEGLAEDRARRLGVDGGVKKKKSSSRKDKKHKHKKSSKDSKKSKKHKKDKDKKHSKKHKKHKRRRHSSSSSSSDSGSTSSKSTSSSGTSSGTNSDSDVEKGDGGPGPVKLSNYLWGK